MEISDLGPIGLPLNPREAQLIKSRAEQRERTVADTSVRDAWQIDAEKVRVFIYSYQVFVLIYLGRFSQLRVEYLAPVCCSGSLHGSGSKSCSKSASLRAK